MRNNLPTVDILSGGFPCQDISNAGKRAGIDGERSGLWSEYARIICELRPRYVVVENVAALLGRGMERVLGDLAACGYDAEWQSIRASDVGAPHRRERIWILAYPTHGRNPILADADAGGFRWPHDADEIDGSAFQRRGHARDVIGQGGEAVADATGSRCKGTRKHGSGSPLLSARSGECGPDVAHTERSGRRPSIADLSGESQPDAARCGSELENAAEPQLERANIFEMGEPHDGRYDTLASRSSWWAVEPDVGRVAYGVPARVDRLRGLGNAIVPQIAEWIGRRIIEADRP